MSDFTITDEDVAKLTALAAILLPGTATMPSVDQIDGFDRLVRTAIRACGYPAANIRAALDPLAVDMDWDQAKALASAQLDAFHVASTLASAAYYMAPKALAGLSYPIDRRHPAEVEDFVSEYETGILDAVTERGPIYRETRTLP